VHKDFSVLVSLKGTSRVRFSRIWFLNFFQFGFLFVLRVGELVLEMTFEFMVMITGEWSEDRSKIDSTCRLFIGTRFTIPKLIRSGTFRLSLGQQVGSPVETCDKTRHGQHHSKILCCSMYCCFVSFCVLFVCKRVLYCCHRVSTQLQLINISYHVEPFFYQLMHIMLKNTEYNFTQCTTHTPYRSQYAAIALTTPCTSFMQILLTKCVIFSQAMTVAPWRWFLRKPKHVGA